MATTPFMSIAAFARIDEPGRFDLIDGKILQMPPLVASMVRSPPRMVG